MLLFLVCISKYCNFECRLKYNINILHSGDNCYPDISQYACVLIEFAKNYKFSKKMYLTDCHRFRKSI